MLQTVKQGTALQAKYEYGYAGGKLRVTGSNGKGYAYLGSLVYICTGSSYIFESGIFREGTVNSSGICYHLKDHLGSIRVVIDGNGVLLEENDYYAFGQRQPRSEHAQLSTNRFKYNGKELQTVGSLGFIDYGARMYDATLERWFNTDPLSEKYYAMSPYNYCGNSPVIYTDPTGEYPVITITNQQTGQIASQRVLGYSGGITIQVPLYNVVVTDTENKDFRMTFSVTRDAWTMEQGNGYTASNVGFEPKNGNINHFTGKVMPNGYPQGNGTEALKLTQYGSEVVHAKANQTAVNMGYRNKSDVASGIMLHVGGYYTKSGKTQLAASEGCFGIVNPNNSSTNPSNEYSNNIINKIINQANSSQTDKGKILIIIQKREGNDYPKAQEIR